MPNSAKLYNLHVAFGLHWYQPHTQKTEVLKKIVDNSYLPILNAIEKKCIGTVNCDISASLIYQLAEHAPQVIEKIIKLRNRKKIALVNTAAYHPILPLVPQSYTKRQLELNESAYRAYKLLGEREKLSGIFPPEMAYGEILQPLISGMGYSWILVDDLPFNIYHNKPTPALHLAGVKGTACIMRSRLWSSEMSFNMPNGAEFAARLCDEFRKQFKTNVYEAYIVLWTDAETFGEHHKNGVENFLKPFFEAERKLSMSLIDCDFLLKHYPLKEIAVPPGSWSSSADDVSSAPYNLWKHPKNEWHSLWWKLAAILLKISAEHTETGPCADKALYSCQTWWWSLYKKKDLFLWALPDIRIILQSGTPQERKTGDDLISRLSNFKP